MELKEKVIKISAIRVFFEIVALYLFIFGVARHDWFMFLGGMFLLLKDTEIIHYNGKKYE